MADKEMKSLEEVIKYKLNFLPKGTEPFYTIQTYIAERGTYPLSGFYDIYETKNPIFSNDSYSFMEDITPLFIYISSCEKYYRENACVKIEWIDIYSLMIDREVLNIGTSFSYNGFPGLREHRISDFKRKRNVYFSRVGYCMRFTEPFKIKFTGGFHHFLTEEEEELRYRLERVQNYIIEQGYYRLGGYDEIEENSPINDSKTFKSDQCVICLEEEPKVLFCNCGHICICKKCASYKHNNCPVCKEKSTILRIIE